MSIKINPSENQVITNRPVLAQVKGELEKKSHKRNRDDLVTIGHKIRDIAQDLTYLKLRDASLDKALEHILAAQKEIEKKLSRG